MGPASDLSEGAPPPPGSPASRLPEAGEGTLGPAGMLAPRPPVLTSLNPQGTRFIYAGSNSGVAQAPVAFCGKHSTCEDCVLARDPYCAWSPATAACVALHQTESPRRYWWGRGAGRGSARPSCASPCPLCPCFAGL